MNEPPMRYVSWRRGKPRFSPGPRLRLLGFKGEDLRHPDGTWFSEREARWFVAERLAKVAEVRKAWPASHVINMPAAKARGASGFVYFLRSGDMVKIGFSTQPAARVASLATAMPEAVDAFVAVPGTVADERRVHRLLKRDHRRGEWFAFTTDVLAFIQRAIARGSIDDHETAAKFTTSPEQVANGSRTCDPVATVK